MTINMRRTQANSFHGQRGMVLLISLVFLLLISMLGVSSMQNATLQEKMTSSMTFRNQSFQTAESVLRAGEALVLASPASLTTCTYCLPPPESTKVVASGVYSGSGSSSGLSWVASGTGFYLVQNLGQTKTPVTLPSSCAAGATVTLYRITAVGNQGASKSVLESIYGTC
jgi:type IV pilus assembly protein PilX